MSKLHVKKGDTVIVLSGADRYDLTKKKGKVLAVYPGKSMVLIEGINMSTKHKKPRGRYQQGGIIHQESAIHSSKVMVVCPRCNKPSRTGIKLTKDGNKYRECKKCGGEVDKD